MNIFFIHIILFSALSLNSSSIFSDNYIGKHKSVINRAFNEKHKNFKLNTAYINNDFNYLKYEDSIKQITVLFFLNDNDNCRMIRVMSDYSNLNDLLVELNTNYTKIGDKVWQFNIGNKIYAITMEEGYWFFTISIKEK